MDNRIKIGFIGVGNMAGAVLRAALSTGFLLPCDVSAIEQNEERVNELKALGVRVSPDYNDLFSSSDIILVGVKPQQFLDIAEKTNGFKDTKHIISIMAAIKIETIRNKLPFAGGIARIMPNLPMTVFKGVSGAAYDNMPSKIKAFTDSLFSAGGYCVTVEEKDLDAVTAISGSGPAYYYYLCAAAAEFAVAKGFDEDTAIKTAANTMAGAAEMLLKSGKHPNELIAQVTSKGGTTLAALAGFEQKGLKEAFLHGMECCYQRAKELSSGE